MYFKIFVAAISLRLLLFPFLSDAQNAHPAFKHYSVEDGLPSSEIYQVKQDSKGYIWFATGNGVSRYNGYEFENFSMNDGLPDNTVFEISEDYSGRIWFVPISCKLSYYYNGKIYSYKYNDELQKLFNNPIKTSFGVDKNGTVFLGVFHDGIYEISATGKITHHFGKDNSMGGVNVIQPDSNFMIYSSAGSNISHTISFNTSLLKGEIALKDNTYDMYGSDRVITTKKGLTLLTLLNKIYSFKNTHEYTVHTLPKRIIWLYEDRDEDLWVGTYLGGVYHFAKGNFNDQSVYLSGLPVNGILQDREGGFWFASEGNGVFYSPSKNILTYDKSVGLSSDKINCLATDGITIFSGTQNGFVNTIRDSVTGSYDLNSSGNPTNGISGLFYDTLKQRVWVSVGSIVNWSKNKKNILHGLSSFNRMLIDDNKKYWIAGSMCLSRVENDKEVFASNSKSQHLKRMNAILKNKNNTLLIGALDGLWLFDMKKETFQYLGDKNPLLKNRILDLAFTNDSLLLIATKGKGLLIYNMNERVYQIDESKGLCGNNVYRVVVDGESIWCATNKGLSKINITETEPLVYTLKKYTTLEGIASNEVNDILKLGKNLWVATNKGISVFDVNSEMNTDVHIPVYITKVMINDSVSELKSDYQLGYSQNNIRISFLGLGYKDPGKLEYRFKMAGLDSSWTISQNRDIQYTTLPPNEYTFILSVHDPNNELNSDITTIHFTIHAPFWRKWWFILLLIFLVLITVFLFFRYRINLIEKREQKSTALNRSFLNLKLKALRAQMNPHFTFNVMNSIQHFIVNKDDESAHRYLSKFSKLIRAILNNSEHNTIPVADEIKALELYLELESMRFEKRFEYSITVDKEINTQAVFIPSMLIQPYVENAIKHGILPLKGNGKIEIEISMENSLLKCVIEDNGIGRVKAEENKKGSEHTSMGTSITKERLIVINEINNSNLSENTIDLADENGNAAGTRVEIYIPIN